MLALKRGSRAHLKVGGVRFPHPVARNTPPPQSHVPVPRTDLAPRLPAASRLGGPPRRPRPRPASSSLWTDPQSPTPARSCGTWPRPSSCDSPLATPVPPPPPPTGVGSWPRRGLRGLSRSLRGTQRRLRGPPPLLSAPSRAGGPGEPERAPQEEGTGRGEGRKGGRGEGPALHVNPAWRGAIARVAPASPVGAELPPGPAPPTPRPRPAPSSHAPANAQSSPSQLCAPPSKKATPPSGGCLAGRWGGEEESLGGAHPDGLGAEPPLRGCLRKEPDLFVCLLAYSLSFLSTPLSSRNRGKVPRPSLIKRPRVQTSDWAAETYSVWDAYRIGQG